jgi:hypothetical protein
MKGLSVIVLIVLIVVLAASAGEAFSAGTRDAECAVPAAIPDDGRDDRGAIQSALDSRGCAYLPAGVYHVDSIQFTPPARPPPMMLDASGEELYGDGPRTVLAFRGSTGEQDWEGVRLGGAGSTLHDLSITTGAITDTAEQTHAVKLLGPATDAAISRVSFSHPIRVGEKSGDCVQVVGFNDGREIARVKIHDNDFVRCDRSGVAVHSGTTQLEIVDNRFEAVGNTDIDFEGTGDTSDVLIAGNRITMSPGPHGVSAIQLQLVEGVRVTNNVLDGRGIDVFQSDDVEIDRNTITLTQATATPVISIAKDSARARIHDNSVTREASAGPGAVIDAGPHGSGTPDHLEIDDNTLVQRTSFHVISSSGLVGLHVRRNAIIYSGELADEMSGVRALGSGGANGIRTTDVRVEANTFDGALRAAVRTSGSLSGVGTLDTAGNVATGATHGIFCDNFASQGGVLGPFNSTGDSWPAPLCGPAGFVKVLASPPTSPPASGGAGGAGPSSARAPETTITKRPPKRTASRVAKFSFRSDQPAARFECKLDRRPFKACRSPYRGRVKPGRHSFQVRAGDANGADPTPAIFRWRVS